MTLSLFSKEQGATTLISLVLYDFLTHYGTVVVLWKKMIKQDSQAIRLVVRTIVLAIQTVLVVLWRYILNGETSPDFIYDQNPAGFAEDRFTRAFSIPWVYCLYIRDAIYPFYLSPDWSGLSIDLITDIKDPRAMCVICLWYFAAISFWSMVVGRGGKEDKEEEQQSLLDGPTIRTGNMAIWAFIFSPFLLSSNILVVVGLMKADRVIYLPLFGFCLLEALLLKKVFLKGVETFSSPTFATNKERLYWMANFLFIFQVSVYTSRTHARNLAWSNSLRLWESAYAINPRSYHTMYNYGYELSIKQRYAEAEAVMRPIGNARVNGPSNVFVYAMVLMNLGRCDDADRFLDIAFDVIDEKRAANTIRDSESSLSRTESNLLVARAHCEGDMYERSRLLYDAVQTDPSNEYAVGLAQEQVKRMKHIEELKRSQNM